MNLNDCYNFDDFRKLAKRNLPAPIFHYIHGGADDNVHIQNTMEMIKQLVKSNKQFDQFIYPDKNHSIYGGNARYHLYKKMTDYILSNL